MSNPEITFVNDNMLLVDGKFLQTSADFAGDRKKTKVSPGELQALLTLGHHAIRSQIDTMFDTMQRRHPGMTIQRGSIWTAKLVGPRGYPDFAYSELGANNNTGITTDPMELKEPYREHWYAIERAGLIPEARRSIGEHIGVWLLSRIDPTPC